MAVNWYMADDEETADRRAYKSIVCGKRPVREIGGAGQEKIGPRALSSFVISNPPDKQHDAAPELSVLDRYERLDQCEAIRMIEGQL